MHLTNEQDVHDARRRGEAQLVAAVIDEAVGDGTGDYYCTQARTGDRVRVSVDDAGVTYSKRTLVLLHRSDDGTLASAAGWIIASEFRPRSLHGSARSLPTTGDEVNSGSAIVLVNPASYLTPRHAIFDLTDSDGIHVHGVGLSGITPSASGATVTLSVAPGFTATPSTDRRMVIAVTVLSVSHGGIAGAYDLTIGDTTYPNFFIVS